MPRPWLAELGRLSRASLSLHPAASLSVSPMPILFGCSYVAGLFALAHDTHSGVRKEVCTGLVQMLQLQPERLAAHMDQIIEYMLESTQVRLAVFTASMYACQDYSGQTGDCGAH